MRLEFHPTASEEFEAATAYYYNEVPGLEAAFISEVERISELIQGHPAIVNRLMKSFAAPYYCVSHFRSFTVLR